MESSKPIIRWSNGVSKTFEYNEWHLLVKKLLGKAVEVTCKDKKELFTVTYIDEYKETIDLRCVLGSSKTIYFEDLEKDSSAAITLTVQEPRFCVGEYVIIKAGALEGVACLAQVTDISEDELYREGDYEHTEEYVDYLTVTARGRKLYEHKRYHPSHLKAGGLATLYPVGTSMQHEMNPEHIGVVIKSSVDSITVEDKDGNQWIRTAEGILSGRYLPIHKKLKENE